MSSSSLSADGLVWKLPPTDACGSSLHVSGHGEWDYDTVLKPLRGGDTLNWKLL